MIPRNQLGARSVAILEALEKLGQSSPMQVSAETGLNHDLARQYLRRCAFRGLLNVAHIGRVPIYTVKEGWRARFEPKPRPVLPPPETTVQRAIRKRPVLQHIFWQGAQQ